MADPQIDHYDYINAPQFVDFDDLASQDDPDADKFFETHREEDDFIIPVDVDSISPTVQFLDENVHYSNEANKAAKAAGLEDVNIEYYASPQQSASLSRPSSSNKKSLNSVYGTPLGGSAMSSSTSFYTPTGEEDKENETPSQNQGSVIKKSSAKALYNEDDTSRGVLSERHNASGVTDQTNNALSPLPAKKISINNSNSKNSTESFISKLQKLDILTSSDDEDYVENDIACLPSGQNDQANSTENLNESSYSTFSVEKLSYLGLVEKEEANDANTDELSVSGDGDATLLVTSGSDAAAFATADFESSESDLEDGEGITAMELDTPVRNILRKLDAELNLVDDSKSVDDPRYSILVAPSVGQQIHWSTDTEDGNIAASMDQESGTALADDNFDAALMTMTNGTSERITISGTYDQYYSFDLSGCSSIVSTNRASSVGDLVKALDIEPKSRKFCTYGYNPRFGVTIPKTPDVPDESEVEDDADKLKDLKSACYFEIEAPKHAKNIRRVSSCSDLVKTLKNQSKATHVKPVKKVLTIPRTPTNAKGFSRNRINANVSTISSVSSTSSSSTAFKSTASHAFAGGNVNRKPMKGNQNHYVSMAEALVNFQKSTPDRFRSLPRGKVIEKRSTSCDARKRQSPSPARSPELSRNPRSRTSSFNEKRDNARSFAPGATGPVLPKKVELKPTVPKPFNFGSSHRPRQVAAAKEDVVDFKFKARPAPIKKQETKVVSKLKTHSKVTQPMSPRFASDDRLRERHQKRAHTTPEDTKAMKSMVPKSSRIPTTTMMARAPVDDHRTTTVQPFSSSFEARQKEIIRRKEEKIKHELEEAKKGRDFHANPVPRFSTKAPKRKPADVTNVEPFRFKSDERGAHYQEAFKRKLEEEERHKKEQVMFVAQPADVIHKAPFEPNLPTRTIEADEFQLATERRAAEREQFDEQIREKEREEEEMRKEEQAKLEEAQREEDVERRRQLVHKAQPFKHPKPFQLKPSSKTLTVPQSPAFQALPSDRRIKPFSPKSE